MARKVVDVFVKGDASVLENVGLAEVLSYRRVYGDWYRLEVEVDGDYGEECREKLQEIIKKLKGLGLKPAQSANYY